MTMPGSVNDRFRIAQDAPAPNPRQLSIQSTIRAGIADVADVIEGSVPPSREQALALTKLEEALMWAGKAIFK